MHEEPITALIRSQPTPEGVEPSQREPDQPAEQHVVVHYSGGVPSRQSRIDQPSVLLGRQQESVQIWVNDASVSRQHCQIRIRDNQAYASDRDSLNHTFVNESQIEFDHLLLHGDILQLGNIRLRYYSRESADQRLLVRSSQLTVQDKRLNIYRQDYLLEKLEEEFQLACYKVLPLSLILLQPLGLEDIELNYGHDLVDHLLKEICWTIKSLMREIDTLGVYQGNAFGLVLPVMPLAAAQKLAKQIRHTLEKARIQYRDQQIPVMLGYGVAGLAPGMESYKDLLQLADPSIHSTPLSGS